MGGLRELGQALYAPLSLHHRRVKERFERVKAGQQAAPGTQLLSGAWIPPVE